MPAGKRLVIEFVSVSMTVDSHLRPSAGIATTSGGTSNQHSLGLQPVNTSEGVTSYVASQSLRLFADPGAEVRMSGGFSPTDATWDDRVFWCRSPGTSSTSRRGPAAQPGKVPPVAASTFVLDWDNPRFTAPARWIGETTQWITLGWAVVVLGRRLG